MSPRATETRGHFLASSLVVIYLLLFLFPRSYGKPFATGLDPSWMYALDVLPDTEFAFGRDVAFTMGPLGYVRTAGPAGPAHARCALLRTFLHLSLGVALFVRLKQTRSRWAFWIFAVCFVVTSTLLFGQHYDVCYEYHLLFLVGLWVSIALAAPHARLWTLCAAAFFAALALFVKLNGGVAAAGMLAMAALGLLVQQRRHWKYAIGSGISYLLMVLALAQVLLGSLRDLPTWLRASYELVRGYSATMALPLSRFTLLRCAGVWAVYLAATLGCMSRRRGLGLMAVSLFPAMFIAFESGIVRHDGLSFFLAPPMMMTLLILSSEESREVGVNLAGFGLMLLLAIPSSIDYWRALPSWRGELIRMATLQRGIERIGLFVTLWSDDSQVKSVDRTYFEADRLSDEWISGIDKAHDTVAVVPWEITYCPANGLRWNATPTLQLYSSYTTWLDHWNAAHFEGRQRPDWTIVHYDSIDGRHLLWDAPATWRALIENHRVARTDGVAGRLLLQKTAQRLRSDLVTVGQSKAIAHEWIDVPDSDTPLYVAIPSSRSLSGTLRQTFFRFPPVIVELLYEDGRHLGARVPPDVMSNGLLINRLPRSAQELAALFECRALPRVRRFRVTGPGSEQLTMPMLLTWKRWMPPCAAVPPA